MPENKVLSYIVTSTMGARDFSCAVSGFGQVFIAIHFATHGFVLRTDSLRPKLNIPPPTKKKYWYSGSGAHNLSIAGLHVTSRRPCWWPRTKAYLSSGMLTPIHVNSSRKIYCFDLQHGRLVT